MKDYTGPNTLLSAFRLIRQEIEKTSEDGGGTSGGVPVGTIVIWSGTASDIPDGWALCDGQDGRPDLRDKFVLGAGPNHPAGETGGSEEVTLTMEQMPSHAHQYIGTYNSASVQSGSSVSGVRTGNPLKDSTTIGGSQPHPNMPPYYALCCIIKTTEDSGGGGSSGGESAGEVYSTEETRIGTWIDGKPLYRGYYSGTFPSGTGSWTPLFEIPNIEILTDSYGCVLSDPQVILPGHWTAFSLSGNRLCVCNYGDSWFSGKEFYIFFEYTKTTDPAVEEA